MKKFSIAILYKSAGKVVIEVPDEYSLSKAIQWAKENTDIISLPYDAEYIEASAIIDEKNCGFENNFS